jgi:hypothetical protein
VASFDSPSPSSTVLSLRGNFSFRATEVAATGSGGATAAPSATPAANGSPGTTALTTAPTTNAVTATSATASSPMARRLSRNWRHDVRLAAANSSGGSTTGRIQPGSMFGIARSGTKASTRPNASSITG